jgi:heme-degrading monooxygenase HmoA
MGSPKTGYSGSETMYAMARTYSGKGAKELVDVLEERRADVEKTLRGVSGMVSYTLVRTNDGGFSVSVWKDKPSIDEVQKLAAQWIKDNASHVKASAPTVNEGSVILQLK